MVRYTFYTTNRNFNVMTIFADKVLIITVLKAACYITNIWHIIKLIDKHRQTTAKHKARQMISVR